MIQAVRGGNAATPRRLHDAMRYDSLGFPIPAEFDLPAPVSGGRGRPAAARRPGPGRGKRLVVLGLLVAIVLPGFVVPVVLPAVRGAVVRWSLQRAFVHEAGGETAAAIGHVGRALAWGGDDAPLVLELLCWRAELRLDVGDASGAAADADRAIALVPTSSHPRRVRALVNVVRARPDEALADADAAVAIAGPTNPDVLNLRAYVRALVGRDLPAALADVDAALVDGGEPPPEFLDTRGYVLHLLGRNREAVDHLTRAIAATDERRRATLARTGFGTRAGAARELRAIDRSLAVMHHHRGLARRALGLDRQAEQDFAIAEQKGYDPSRGVM